MFKAVYNGKRVLVTGHTGFKGSWLCLWLRELGADVAGYALPPLTDPNHFELLGGGDGVNDLRNFNALQKPGRFSAGSGFSPGGSAAGSGILCCSA